MKRNGIVTFGELQKQFENNKFLPSIDAVYLKYGIAIGNDGRRIFPELLSQKSIQISTHYFELLKNSPGETKYVAEGKLDMTDLLSGLSELKLQCIDVSKIDGLFSWEDNAAIYYSFQRSGNVFDGFSTRCNFRVGGKSERISTRLRSEFVTLLSRLFGPFVDLEKKETDKKKVKNERSIIFDVAISYASEQGSYANALAEILRAQGIVVFFDQFFEGKMWGKDLSEYLMEVYYKQANFCIMLISKEYVSKAWPTHERRSAVARNIAEFGEYILPIRFDESEIPGLPPTVKYLNGLKKTPAEVADLFLAKQKE